MNFCKNCKHSILKIKETPGAYKRHSCSLFIEFEDMVSGAHVYLPCGLARKSETKCGPTGTKYEAAKGFGAFIKRIRWYK